MVPRSLPAPRGSLPSAPSLDALKDALKALPHLSAQIRKPKPLNEVVDLKQPLHNHLQLPSP